MTFALQRPLKIHQNKTFIGRRAEMHRFQEIEARQEASLVVVYGRRRVGKTELIEQYFRERRLIKFEGLEGASPEAQISHFLYQLSKYTKDPLVSQLKFGSW
ncbi:MAG: ATP-binding protein, partial [Chlamydiae bacterium]|nr:ATP-binding protein [Chlamydiota bacterium]